MIIMLPWNSRQGSRLQWPMWLHTGAIPACGSYAGSSPNGTSSSWLQSMVTPFSFIFFTFLSFKEYFFIAFQKSMTSWHVCFTISNKIVKKNWRWLENYAQDIKTFKNLFGLESDKADYFWTPSEENHHFSFYDNHKSLSQKNASRWPQ